MGKSLIITEKPSVARDFASVLHVSGRQDGYLENKDYVITWCVGHLVGLVYPESYDEKYKKWKLEDLPFLPEDYIYDVIPNVKKQYQVVHGMLQRQDIDRVYWAGDAGKEGQTIEENIRSYGGVREGMEELRVWIDSQTEEEILRGIREARPMSDYANLGKSGIMRTIEDYAMGINFSRVMSVKYGRLLNDAAATRSYTAIAVGRVMTCVLGMVVNREREIRGFRETPFYRVIGRFASAGIEAEWKAVEGSAFFESPLLYKENGFKEEKDAQVLIETLKDAPATVQSIEKSTSKKRAPLLFNLAELQAECAKKFKISPDETLACAQELYEKKLTTYPRTDARVLSTAVAKEIAKNISRLKNYAPTEGFADEIMEKKLYKNITKTQYTDDSKVTDHYAIIPTGQLTELKSLNSLQYKVFELIVRRFLSIFYPPAVYQNVKMAIGVKKETFFTSAKILKDPGFLAVAIPPKRRSFEEENARILGGQSLDKKEKEEEEAEDKDKLAVNPEVLLKLADELHKGDEIEVKGYHIKYGKTSPPKRYTSGSMVLAMENAGQLIEEEELREQIRGSGIGTSATRAEIIQKLVRIHYLNLNRKNQVLSPENLGEMVYEVVSMTVPALLNPKMTASWEKGLDGITNGNVDFWEYRNKLEDFIRRETERMISQDIHQPLAERISSFAGKDGRGAGARRRLGVRCPDCDGEIVTTPFGYGCSNYKKDKSGCNFNIGEIAGVSLTEEQVKMLLEQGHTETIRGFKSKAGKRFDARLVLVKEKKPSSVQFNFTEVEPEIIADVFCPVCGGQLCKTSFGYGCVNYKKEGDGCRFSIGKLAGKKLTEAQVKKLFANGITDTIRGFKSKNGKKFDARVALSKDDEGKVTGLKFDFDNLEIQTVKGVKCPLCGGKVTVTPFGYGCANYKREGEGCRFSIGRIAGVSLKESQVKELLLQGKTEVIKGFVAKTGMMFDASLRLNEEGRVEFDFPEKPKPQESKVPCPKCQKMLKRGQWQYECECGFKLWHTVAKIPLTEETVMELLAAGRTQNKIEGFVSKAGNVFDSYLKYEDDTIKFDFNNQNNDGENRDKNENYNKKENHNQNEEPGKNENHDNYVNYEDAGGKESGERKNQ